MPDKEPQMGHSGNSGHMRQVGPSFLSPYPKHVMQKIKAAKAHCRNMEGGRWIPTFLGSGVTYGMK